MHAPAPSFEDLLRDPATGLPVTERDGRLLDARGRPVPLVAGFPSFLPRDRPLRHRLWTRVYNATAFGYDFGVRVGWRLGLGGAAIDRDAYLSRLDLRPGMRVLEAAVGTGDNLLALPGRIELFGFDQSVAMLRRCLRRLAARGRSAGLVLADMARAPFVDNAFDLVFHMGGLQFLQDPRRGLAEMHRMARPGAQVLAVEEAASEAAMTRRSGATKLADLVPDSATDARIEMISNGELIAIEFRK